MNVMGKTFLNYFLLIHLFSNRVLVTLMSAELLSHEKRH